MSQHTSTIPTQHDGGQMDVSETIRASSPEQAIHFFEMVKDRMLNINRWHELIGLLSANFMLTDEDGKEVRRLVSVGDYVKIDIPGPGSKAGEGYDWVKVQSITQCDEDNAQIISITVRPAPNPSHAEPEVAHFFKDQATSTFMIERNDLTITASVHGRNEIPNTETHHRVDRVRNALVARSASAGISNIQWDAWAKSMLKDLNKTG